MRLNPPGYRHPSFVAYPLFTYKKSGQLPIFFLPLYNYFISLSFSKTETVFKYSFLAKYNVRRFLFMKQTRFTETQIVAILKEADSGMLVKDVCGKHVMNDVMHYIGSQSMAE